MSDVANAPARTQAVAELRVSGHLMTLEPGLFCIVHSAAHADPRTGLPGVRISLPPQLGDADAAIPVSIAAFRPDGWLSGTGDAALVRVFAPCQVLVTVYQSPDARDTAPNLQVLRLLEHNASAAQAGAVPTGAPTAIARPTIMEVVAHIQKRGDVGAMLGEWLGERGSGSWIEGFGIAPSGGIASADIEYQAVLGRDWLSPWVGGGEFCGSRGMGLPILGLRARLRGAAAEASELAISASFVDGTAIGPVRDGEPCEAGSLSPLEAFQITVQARAETQKKGKRGK